MFTANHPYELGVPNVCATLVFAAAYSVAKLNPPGLVLVCPKLWYQFAATEFDAGVLPEII